MILKPYGRYFDPLSTGALASLQHRHSDSLSTRFRRCSAQRSGFQPAGTLTLLSTRSAEAGVRMRLAEATGRPAHMVAAARQRQAATA